MAQEQYSSLINEINSIKFSSIKIDTNNIDNIINMYESFISKKLVPINFFKKNLKRLDIHTNCIHCNKIALYYNADNEQEKLCWTHSQSI